MADDVRCVLVKIHGIGNQAQDWSKRFDRALQTKINTLPAAQRGHILNESVWWGNLSMLPGIGGTAAAGPLGGPAELQFTLVQQAYASHLMAQEASAAGATAAFGISLDLNKVVARLKDLTVHAVDQANDVANYVSHNGVRIQIQSLLNRKLFELQDANPNATIILGSHSQGSIVAYDVLRLNGAQLPRLKTWVTMGSPLAWYLNFARWGAEPVALPAGLNWLNFYDKDDRVGTTVAGMLRPPTPTATDVDVKNAGQGLDPHDHWHNPDVVDRYFQLITAAMA